MRDHLAFAFSRIASVAFGASCVLSMLHVLCVLTRQTDWALWTSHRALDAYGIAVVSAGVWLLLNMRRWRRPS